ncbi:MAG TPA: hypothetical protein PKD91_10190, partial [Bacteroidia bacterium]|nr:hypothetical protein [Bacteroidia bacterium]
MKKPQILIPLIILSCLSLLVISCKDDDDPAPTPTVYDNYAQLKVGNYWIYQHYDVDSSGNATSTSVYDSCYVEKDTIINNLTYFKMIRPNPYPPLPSEYYLRDSLHYVIDPFGNVLFSSLDFTTIFDDYYHVGSTPGDTLYRVIKKMTEKDWIVTTPAGLFQTSNMKISYHMFPNWSFAGSERAMNTRYAKNVGIVSETLPFFASNPNYLER